MIEFIDTYLWWILLIGTVIYLSMYASSNTKPENDEDEKKIRMKLASMANFDATQKVSSWLGTDTLAIDEQREKISFCFTKENWKTVECKVYDYRDILGVEILENGTSIIKTSRNNQLEDTALGGHTRSKYNEGGIRHIVLKIVLNDIKFPMYTLYLYEEIVGLGIEPTSIAYKKIIMEAQKWHSLISILFHQTDKEDNAKEHKDNIEANNNLSIADEIIKLKSLADENIITENEYSVQKDKLLNQ